MMSSATRRLRLAGAALAVGALHALAAPAALGALTASPNPSTTGSYTVSGSVAASRVYEWMTLIETAPDSATQTFGLSGPSNIGQSFSGKAPGTWVYRVEGCYFEYLWDIQEVLEQCEYVGASLSVTVQLPPADKFPGFAAAPAASRAWKQNSAIAEFAFEAATGGDGTLTYTASGLPAGVTMSGERRFSGTPTAAGAGTATVTATDEDGDEATKSFAWSVAEDLVPAFGATPIAAKTWKQNTAIDEFTLPEATGGDLPLAYAIASLPDGLTMSPSGRVSGTPTATGAGTARYSVTDADGDEAAKSFAWSVAADLKPMFGATPIEARSWTQNQAIQEFTFETATDGDGTLSYAVRGLPAGVAMSSARQFSGTPTAAGSGTATVTATDADGDKASKSFAWTVAADLKPKFGSTPVAARSWTENEAIPAFAFEAASGGDAPLRYSVEGLPGGVSMSSARRISGTPTAAGSGTATVTATDSDGDEARKSFSWTVAPADRRPSFGSASIGPRSWVAGNEIAAFAAPAATGGDAPLRYGARGLPAGVNLVKANDADAYSFSGTPTAAGSGTATLVVVDNDGDRATLSFAWTVAADSAPSFGTASVTSKSWTLGEAIASFTLPSAAGGNGAISYGAAGLPAGVIVSPSLQVSGVPRSTGTGTATLTARDADGDTATLKFAWTVTSSDAPAGALLSVTPNPTTSPDFTVVGSYAGTREYVQLILTETGPRGHTAEFDVGGAFSQGFLFNQDIANRANGTYTYSLKGCYLKSLAEIKEAEEVCETVGDPLTVTVNGPAPDSVAAQLQDTWEARASVADGNGLKHLYLKRTSEAVGGGLLRDVILRQTSAGGFAVESAPPGSANAAEGAAWPLTTAVDVVQNDINLDGFVDILLRGLGKAVGVGAQDQMVYASGRFPTVILNAVDDEVRNFLAEVDAWTQSPTYFQTRVIQYSEPIIRWRSNCLDGGDYPDLDNVCYSVPVVVGYRIVTVPTNVSAAARAFAGLFNIDDDRIDTNVLPGTAAARGMDRILREAFGAEFLDGRMDDTCPATVASSFDAIREWCENAREFVTSIFVSFGWTKREIENRPPPGRLLTDREKDFLRDYGPPASGDYNVDTIRIVIDSEVNYRLLSGVIATVPEHKDIVELERQLEIVLGRQIIIWNEGGYEPEGFTTRDDLSDLVHESVHVWQNTCEACTYLPTSILSEQEYVFGEDLIYRDANGPIHDRPYDRMFKEEQAYLAGDRASLHNGGDPKREGNIRKINGRPVGRQDMLNEINCVDGIFEVPAVPKSACN